MVWCSGVLELWFGGWGRRGFGLVGGVLALLGSAQLCSSVHNSTSYSQIRSFSPTIQQTHQEQGQEEHTRPRQIKKMKMRRDKKRRSARTQKGWGETNARY